MRLNYIWVGKPRTENTAQAAQDLMGCQATTFQVASPDFEDMGEPQRAFSPSTL